MVLYLAEKKVLAEAIADALPGKAETKNGAIVKGDHVVTWLSGHLLTLREPEAYDQKYKKWELADLPIYFEPWANAIPKENKEKVDRVAALIKQADCVVNCGDVDEEGQLLVDEMLRYFQYHGPCKRLDTANTTVDALKKALGKMKDNKTCENDGWSAYARQVSDMTFGINLTRYFSKTFNALLPVGRVQTPTLGMVVMRDLAIEGHQKTFYYTLSVLASINGFDISTSFQPEKDLPELTDGKFLTPDYCKRVQDEITGKEYTFTIKKENVKEGPPLPFNLTVLNNFCGKKWGMNPDKVMKITQALRDDYSAITYNRSDCQYLSEEHYQEAPETISAVCANVGLPVNNFNTKIKSRCFNDANITAHFAIIPTNTKVDIQKLSQEQKNVYLAICMYYLIQFLPPCEKVKTTAKTDILMNGKKVGILSASVSEIIKPGFMALLRDDGNEDDESEENEKKNQNLCKIPEGQHSGRVKQCVIDKKETKPPKRYTQTSLYDDMTKISKYVDDPEIKKLLLEKDKEKKGENGSIGTSATRAEIIKKLITNGFVEEKKEGKKEYLISTKKGRQFYALLPNNIKKADTTALWWVVQEDIKNGKCDYTKLTRNVLETVNGILKGYQPNAEDLKVLNHGGYAEQEFLCKCPSCGAEIKSGKFGPYCSGKCGFRMSMVFGKKLTEKQFVSLCKGERVKIKGIKKKSGDGTFDAYAVPKGVEEYSYTHDGKEYKGKQLKVEMAFS